MRDDVVGDFFHMLRTCATTFSNKKEVKQLRYTVRQYNEGDENCNYSTTSTTEIYKHKIATDEGAYGN